LLEDPTVQVNPEALLELKEKYKIDYLLNFYAQFDAEPGVGDFYSATASVELRLIDAASATVISASSSPMGVVGNPPSDGFTKKSALINALQRSVDEVLGAIGIEVFAPAEPRRVRISMKPIETKPVGDIVQSSRSAVDRQIAGLASLERMTWKKETASVTAKSPDGNYGAVASYTWEHNLGSRRHYGSRIHIIDLKTRRTPNIFDFSELGVSKRHERASKEILAALFLGSWRFLVAVNGNEIIFWDVETGRELSRIRHGEKAKKASIRYIKNADGGFLEIDLKRDTQFYKISADR
jgi:hypothetical protein